MKTSRKLLTLAASMFAFAAIMTPQAMAAQTPPCTAITNTATLTYSVGSVPQPVVDSDDGTNGAAPTPTTFNVGVKVVLDVTNQDGGNVTVTPSITSKYVLEFLVTNSGNSTHDYLLQAINEGTDNDTIASPYGGGNDTFSPTAGKISIWEEVDDDTAVGFHPDDDLYLGGETPANTLQNVLKDTTRTVYIVYTPDDLTAEDESIGIYYLQATTRWADGTGLPALTAGNATGVTLTNAMTADTVCGETPAFTVDVVVGDEADDVVNDTYDNAARNGIAIDDSAFIVASPNLVVTKLAAIYSDPINGSPGKAIPGAVVTYTITIENIGSFAATDVTFTDDLTAVLVNADFGNTVDGFYKDGTTTCVTDQDIVVSDGVNTATAACKTNADDPGSETDPDAKFVSNTVTVEKLTIEKDKTATVQFQVTLK